MNALSLSHAPRPSLERPLDKDLRGYLETNRDTVTKMCETDGSRLPRSALDAEGYSIERVCFDSVRVTSANLTQVCGKILDRLAKATKSRPEC